MSKLSYLSVSVPNSPSVSSPIDLAGQELVGVILQAGPSASLTVLTPADPTDTPPTDWRTVELQVPEGGSAVTPLTVPLTLSTYVQLAEQARMLPDQIEISLSVAGASGSTVLLVLKPACSVTITGC